MAGLFGLFWLLALATTTPFCFGANVTYDHRALVIDGRRRVLVSGSIHYPRSTPDVGADYWNSHFGYRYNFVCVYVMVFVIFFFFFVLGSDVAGLDTEIERRWIGCDRDLCFLEFAWTSSRPGDCLSSSSFFIDYFLLYLLRFSFLASSSCVRNEDLEIESQAPWLSLTSQLFGGKGESKATMGGKEFRFLLFQFLVRKSFELLASNYLLILVDYAFSMIVSGRIDLDLF